MDLSLYHPGKSSIRKWFEHATSPTHTRHVMHHGLSAVRMYGEGAVAGAVLGLAKAELKEGLDPNGVPLDLVMAAAGLVAGALPGFHDLALDARVVGAVGLASYTARETEKYLRTKKGQMAGDFGADPVSSDPIVSAGQPIVEQARR